MPATRQWKLHNPKFISFDALPVLQTHRQPRDINITELCTVYLIRTDSLGHANNASDAGVDDGNCVVLDVRRLLYVLLHLADPSLLELLQALRHTTQHTHAVNYIS